MDKGNDMNYTHKARLARRENQKLRLQTELGTDGHINWASVPFNPEGLALEQVALDRQAALQELKIARNLVLDALRMKNNIDPEKWKEATVVVDPLPPGFYSTRDPVYVKHKLHQRRLRLREALSKVGYARV